MLPQQLIDAVQALPLKQKEELRQYLGDCRKEVTAEGRLHQLISLMETAAGATITMTERKRPQPGLRAIICSRLLEEGFTPEEVASAMGKSRVSVGNMRDSVQQMRSIPKAYPREARALADFTNILNAYDQRAI